MTATVELTQRLAVLPLSDHEWRLSDPTREEEDGRAVVGFIEKHDGTYEAMLLEATPRLAACDTLGAAVAFVTQMFSNRVSEPVRLG